MARRARPAAGLTAVARPARPAAGLTAVARPARPAAGITAYRESVRVTVSSDAAEFVRTQGGRLWVWAAPPRMCCSGAPAWMHAATEPPPGLAGFSQVAGDDVQVWFRGVGDLRPDVLEIGLRGKRRPKVAAYWDGCLMAMV